jgi:hypothetical protein
VFPTLMTFIEFFCLSMRRPGFMIVSIPPVFVLTSCPQVQASRLFADLPPQDEIDVRLDVQLRLRLSK